MSLNRVTLDESNDSYGIHFPFWKVRKLSDSGGGSAGVSAGGVEGFVCPFSGGSSDGVVEGFVCDPFSVLDWFRWGFFCS